MRTVSMMLVFVAMQLVHVLKHADEAKDMTGKPLGVVGFFRQKKIRILVRIVAGDLIALAYLEAPEVFALMGMPAPRLPVGYTLAGLSGFFWDSVLKWIEHKIPAVGEEIPDL